MRRTTDIFDPRFDQPEGRFAGLSRTQWGHLLWAGLLLGMCVFLILALAFPIRHSGGSNRRGNTIAEIQRMAEVVRAFKADVGRCPTNGEGLEALVTCPKGVAGWKGPYLKRVPLDAWGDAYRYQCPASYGPDEFTIDSCGPNRSFGDVDDVLYTERW